MGGYTLSEGADARITEIYKFSIENWGLETAQEYFFSLHDVFELLAINPKMGREFHEFRRHEFRSHIIFYTELDNGIQITQIYHKAQDLDGLF